MNTYQSEDIAELATALCSAQAALQPAAKDGQNPHLKNRYTSLTGVFAALREVLPKHGLAVTQTLIPSDGGKAHVRTTLMHKSGQWIAGECVMPLDKQGGPQGMGSAITYARRYSLSAIVGVVSEDDDDGNAAQGKGKPKTPPKPTPEGRPDKGPSALQIKAMFAAIGETLPYLKSDGDEIKRILGLLFSREILSSKELSSGEVSYVISNAAALREFAPSEEEYKNMKARAPISEATREAIEAQLQRLNAPIDQLPPGFDTAYGSSTPAELTEQNGKTVLAELKAMAA